MTNLFKQSELPDFKHIDAAKIEVTVRDMLDHYRQELDIMLSKDHQWTWDNLMQPLEDMGDAFHKVWSPIAHMHSVMETDLLRRAYNDALPHITKYHTEMSQNVKLYNAVNSLVHNEHFDKLDPAQRKILENDLRDFKLSGVDLPEDKKARVGALHHELSFLTTKFSENVLDATHGWTLHVTDPARVSGLPPQALELAATNARHRDLEGYVFTLEYPSYSTAIRFLDDRDLRKQLYEAFVTRASDQGPTGGKWDNLPVMNAILKARDELAKCIGYDNFVEYSLVPKMAKTPSEVLNFLNDLLTRSKWLADKEYKDIEALAKKDGIDKLQAWDAPYYSEKLSKALFDFNQEDLRPWFPIDKVMQGMFEIMHRIYGLTIKETKEMPVWHDQVKFYSVFDDSNALRGGFYIDLYARPHKRDGAWMDDCRSRRLLEDKTIQHPVAYLTCNFMEPVGNQPALLTHDDVITLFHEFGHCLHHMLTQVDYTAVSGINGVPWDAVEFPSQIMENFCWEKESLALIAEHYQTKEPLPDALLKKMLDARHFQTGLQMVRQLEFALFDFHLHLDYDPSNPSFIQDTLDAVRRKTAVTMPPAFNRFQNSFSHIFAGGYAAGYYSYKWAEVLSSDAYAQFEEHGVLDRNTGRSFMQNMLEVGGVRDPMESFIAFRGRKPTVDALLRLSGITEDETL